MTRYSIEPRIREMLTNMDFYNLQENIKSDFWMQGYIL